MNLLSNSLRQVCSFESKSAETILLVNRLFSNRFMNQSTLLNEYVKLNESVISSLNTLYDPCVGWERNGSRERDQ